MTTTQERSRYYRPTSQLRFQHRLFTGPVPAIGFLPYEGAHYSVVLQQLWLSYLHGGEPQWRDVMVDGAITSASQDPPTRPTDNEIWAKIAYFQTSIEDEEANGLAGGEDWMEAVTAQRWLKWTLGE